MIIMVKKKGMSSEMLMNLVYFLIVVFMIVLGFFLVSMFTT